MPRPRKLAIIEPLALFLLVMAYIWILRFRHPYFWTAIIACLLLSHTVHRERPRDLGFGRRSLRECARQFAPLLAMLALLLVAGGVLLHTTRDIAFDRAFLALAAYLPWGLLQQYLLNGYMLNRFDEALSPQASAWFAATAFSVAHTPNFFLMIIGLVLGWCATQVYRRHRNLYFLGLAHATIGFLLFVTVPDTVSHHLNVGPGLLRQLSTRALQ